MASQNPGARSRPGRGRAANRTRARPSSWPRGLRWVPVPLALLAALIGVLVMGSFQGQVAAANANQTGYQAGGISLSVDTMMWMMNMEQSKGYQMPASEMPGMQLAGVNRLRVEVGLTDASTSVQRYSTADFSVSGPGGKIYKNVSQLQEHSDLPASADLQPGFGTTIDVYFDIPSKQAKNLTFKWSRGGTTVSIPVDTNGMPANMHM